MVLGRIMSCGVLGGTPEWVQRQHCDHGFGEGRGKYSGRWDKVSQSEVIAHDAGIVEVNASTDDKR